MPENQPETPIPEEISQPTTTPEPTEPVSISPSTSAEPAMPPEVPEAPPEAESTIPVKDDNEPISPENGSVEQTAPADAEAGADRETEKSNLNEK